MVCREGDAESSSFVLLAVDRNFAAMLLDQSINQHHADAGTCYPLVDGILASEELLEHFLLVGCRNAYAGIADS